MLLVKTMQNNAPKSLGRVIVVGTMIRVTACEHVPILLRLSYFC